MIFLKKVINSVVKSSPLTMQLCVKMASQKALQKVTTAESLILIESSDVHITTSSLCEGGFTKVTVEFFLPNGYF